jgi:hypothetical protein
MAGKRNLGRKFAVGCSGCLGLPVLLFGIFYAFGQPYCIDAPCTDTAQTGGTTIVIGGSLVAIAVANYIGLRRDNESPSEADTEPGEEA